MKKYIHYILVALCAVFLVTACSDDDDDGDLSPEWGSMDITMSGDLQGSVSPEFNFFYIYTGDASEGDAFMLSSQTYNPEQVGGDEGSFLINFIRRGMVSSTSYSVVDGTSDNADAQLDAGHIAVQVWDNRSGNQRMGISTGGSISFSSASDDFVAGSFNITVYMIDTQSFEELTVNFSGDFEAPRYNAGVPPDFDF